MSKLFFYILIGKISIYFIQIFPPTSLLFKIKYIGEYLEKLFTCDLCLGVYVFGVFAWLLHIDLITLLGFSYIPFISELITGAITSFVVHIFSIGWKEKFGVFEVK